jgi:hypothetical protein
MNGIHDMGGMHVLISVSSHSVVNPLRFYSQDYCPSTFDINGRCAAKPAG